MICQPISKEFAADHIANSARFFTSKNDSYLVKADFRQLVKDYMDDYIKGYNTYRKVLGQPDMTPEQIKTLQVLSVLVYDGVLLVSSKSKVNGARVKASVFLNKKGIQDVADLTRMISMSSLVTDFDDPANLGISKITKEDLEWFMALLDEVPTATITPAPLKNLP